jgi:hypothetical protein
MAWGGKREGAGQKGYRSKSKRLHVVVPEEYVDKVKKYIKWLDEQTYPEIKVETPDIDAYLAESESDLNHT